MSVFRSLRNALVPNPNAIIMPAQLLPPEGAIQIRLRPMVAEDEARWSETRQRNAAWLAPWDSNDPMHGPGLTFNTWLQRQRNDEASGAGALFVIEYQMAIIGQISVGAICYGSMRSGNIGYWIDQQHAGHGVAPLAVAMLADWAMFSPTGPRLHRLEISMLPENQRSRRVAEKLQAHHEGIRFKSMYIHNQWRDHDVYSLLAEDAPLGFTRRLLV
ncbi:GNAT family protein [Bifidobacterium sp. ESL0769]|uniref:GNAT family N-acetyltransferase n=1 Tax=Bifidobacterium sp. ESL0769 TaxID=2983229 RepID=UPI0023F7D1BB|nr:GNAT family protein [Bifidobacterium sp. ESL0769]WEV67804.1 GNAT family protein [Bifidobacterium sp. ESL0769]